MAVHQCLEMFSPVHVFCLTSLMRRPERGALPRVERHPEARVLDRTERRATSSVLRRPQCGAHRGAHLPFGGGAVARPVR